MIKQTRWALFTRLAPPLGRYLVVGRYPVVPGLMLRPSHTGYYTCVPPALPYLMATLSYCLQFKEPAVKLFGWE